MKLWQKSNTQSSEQIERFTVGDDRRFDVLLAKYDVQGSIAHVKMLEHAGLMNKNESSAAIRSLENILQTIEQNKFKIDKGVEDVHSQIEMMLTEELGDTGKKIHSGRSRNDQIALDIKLFLKDELLQIKNQVHQLFELLIKLSEQYRDALLPGYTHLQVAMPSSFGLWFGAYAESLVDDLELLVAAYNVINKNPLGSGAGYGTSLKLDREMTTRLLGFASLNVNSVYAQMTRGKAERFAGVALAAVASTLSRLSMDCCLYMSQNFDFISFPPEFTTGSSIMPHKKNPDVFELIRARCNRLQSVPNELTLLTTNLPSGYHRDLQLTKEILFPGIEQIKSCLQMAHLMLSNIKVKDDILSDPKYTYIFSVEAVNALVNQGVPFREAYKRIGDDIEKGIFHFDARQMNHTHIGSLGNLSNEKIIEQMDKVLEKFDE